MGKIHKVLLSNENGRRTDTILPAAKKVWNCKLEIKEQKRKETKFFLKKKKLFAVGYKTFACRKFSSIDLLWHTNLCIVSFHFLFVSHFKCWLSFGHILNIPLNVIRGKKVIFIFVTHTLFRNKNFLKCGKSKLLNYDF